MTPREAVCCQDSVPRAPALEFSIPGAPRSPNRRAPTTRGRMAHVKLERTRAYLSAVCARNVRGWRPIEGRARIAFVVYRQRLLDPMVNLPASLKSYQDGVCKALLPRGDGPGTPYEWLPPSQVRIRWPEAERVLVRIELP